MLKTVLFYAACLNFILLMSGYPLKVHATETQKPLTKHASEHTTERSSLIPLQLSAGEWPPFLSESLPHQGVVAHLLSDIFAVAGYQVSFTFLPWGRAYHDSANGKYAATAIWMQSEDRTSDFLYSEPVLSEKFVFFHLKKRPFEWQQLSDLRGLHLGGGLGYSYGPAFDQALQMAVFKMSRVGSTEQNFRRLAAGRIDAFAEEISVGYHTLQHQLPELADAISHHPKPLLINQSFLLFPHKMPDSVRLAALFNQQLQQFKQSGRYQTYFDRLAQGDYQ
ncbi:periplasmic component of amino acid ABC-type transporter/signal transduction system [Rheinheimera sp. A13L]|uniref:substrate-binding periplasmic protein n=1 Tax=Rheinheimera sp. A13L TaxID=506534 RepID=UPI0002124A87|nr:transporter substrate-binding domain-containing protein [Rheinheimera sp. A13L]EGM77128.1 periplasmic component of amino acid ABC-type transporter/signal transduction system [Rheinheimera sp. A13L]